MKNLVYLTLILSSISFFSCNKGKNVNPNTSNSSQISEVEEMVAQRGDLCVCSKTTSCSCDEIAVVDTSGDDGNGLFLESDYTLYQAALNGGTLPNFFSTSNWEGVFPMLHEKPDVLAGLISGELTIIELEGSMNSTMIVCVHHSKTANNFSLEDAYFALQVAN